MLDNANLSYRRGRHVKSVFCVLIPEEIYI